MPFDPEFDAVYTDLIAQPLTDAGFEVMRADDVQGRQNVMRDVVQGIADADLIVADLTTLNANVFYELGLAHALGIPTVLIAHQEASQDIPFDLRQYRTEFYDTHFQRARTIVESLQELGRLHARGELTFGSPVSDFLPSAGTPRPLARGAQSTVGPQGGLEPDSRRPKRSTTAEPEEETSDDDPERAGELGYLDFLESLTAASELLEATLEPINEATTRVGDETASVSSRLDEVGESDPRAPARVKKLLLQAAKLLSDYASVLEEQQRPLEAAVDGVTSSGLGYLTLLAADPVQNEGVLRDALATVRELGASVDEATGGVEGLRAEVAGLPPVMKEVNRARDRTVRALEVVLAQFARVKSYSEQAEGLIETSFASK